MHDHINMLWPIIIILFIAIITVIIFASIAFTIQKLSSRKLYPRSFYFSFTLNFWLWTRLLCPFYTVQLLIKSFQPSVKGTPGVQRAWSWEKFIYYIFEIYIIYIHPGMTNLHMYPGLLWKIYMHPDMFCWKLRDETILKSRNYCHCVEKNLSKSQHYPSFSLTQKLWLP